jgi:ParG
MGRNVEEPVFVRFRTDYSKRERFKIATIRLRTTMDEILNQLLEAWLEENDPSGDSGEK